MTIRTAPQTAVGQQLAGLTRHHLRLPLFIFALGVVVAILQLFITRDRGPTGIAAVGYFAFGLFMLVVTVIAMLRRKLWSRAAWLMIATVLAMHLLGLLYRILAQEGKRAAALDSVGVADAFFVVAYLLGLGGLAYFVHHTRRRTEFLWQLDAVIVFAAAWILGFVYLISPLWLDDSPTEVLVIQLFYLTVNAFVLALAVRLLLTTLRWTNLSLRLVVVAAMLFTITDLITSALIVNGIEPGFMEGAFAAANVMTITLFATGITHESAVNEPGKTPEESRLSLARTISITALVTLSVALVPLGLVGDGFGEASWLVLVDMLLVLILLLAIRSATLVQAYRRLVIREGWRRQTMLKLADISEQSEAEAVLREFADRLGLQDIVDWSWYDTAPEQQLHRSAARPATDTGDTDFIYQDTFPASSRWLVVTLKSPLLIDPEVWELLRGSSQGAADAMERIAIRNQRVRESENQRLQGAMTGTQDALFIVNENHEVTLASGAVAELTGESESHWQNRPVADLLENADTVLATVVLGEAPRRLVSRIKSTEAKVEVTYHRLESGDVSVSIHDITQLSQLSDELAHRATHDDLTQLPNRRQLIDWLTEATGLWSMHGLTSALVLFDVDQFKVVNDSLGHSFGDVLLSQIAERMSQVGGQNRIGRLGSDEFLILMSPGTVTTATSLARQVMAAFRQPLEVFGVEVQVRLTAGVCQTDETITTAEEFLQAVDLALNAARDRGRGEIGTYDPYQRRHAQTQLEAANLVTKAANESQFFFKYQPIFSLADQRMVAIEALMRLPEGMPQPDEFIPIAESLGELNAIWRKLFYQALADLAELRTVQPEMMLSVNLQASALLDHDIDDWMLSALAAAKIPPEAVVVEISERSLLPVLAIEVVTRLREAGVACWIDDFGTGWSNLAALANLPVQGVKLARELVVTDAQELNVPMIKAALAICNAAGFGVIAEGVEKRKQLDILAQLGVEYVQGFAYARPMTATELRQWLDSEMDVGQESS